MFTYSHAFVTFSFNFNDPAGVGFNAVGQVGADRRAALQASGDYISGILGPGYTANIILDVDGSQTADSTLASASSNFSAPFPGNGFDSAGDVQLKILGGDGADPAPGVADGVVDWNFEDFQWEPFNDFQPGEIDLQNTAIHELTHAIGFASDILENGTSGFGDAPGTPTAWSPFDEFVADSNGSLIDNNGVLDGNRWNAASIGGAGISGLIFNGPNAVAANGGNPVFLYSPDPWLDGSSGSHLDTDVYDGTGGTLENMMNHASTLSEGLDIREYTAIEIGILKDIGYTLIGVPEPASAMLLLAGVIGMLGLRRKF